MWLLGWQGTFLTLLLVYLFARMELPVYLLDFHVWEPPASWKVLGQEWHFPHHHPYIYGGILKL